MLTVRPETDLSAYLPKPSRGTTAVLEPLQLNPLKLCTNPGLRSKIL